MSSVRMILDTDIGDDIDDALALAVALNSPEIELVGVTTVFRDAPRRAILAQKVLEKFGATDIPIVAGISDPLLPDWDSLRGGQSLGRQFEVLDCQETWDGTAHAVPFLIHQVREAYEAGRPLTLVPIGPLTNIAVAMVMAPDIAQKCRIVMMGGRWSQPDEIGEWNVRCDPEAAAIVFRSGAEIDMVGLDVTNQCILDIEEETRFYGATDEPTMFLAKLAKLWVHRITLHDPLTILTLFSDVVRFEPRTIEVALCPKGARGRTLVTEGHPNVRVAVEVDVKRAKTLFLERALQR